jgi:hypothetical protein
VSGATLANAQVSVYEGTTRIGGATADAQGTWSTTVPLTEGSHTLRANATNGVTTSDYSAAASVVVDRSPPTILARMPQLSSPGPTNVWSRDPIVVTFSKPIDPASLTDTSVQINAATSGTISKGMSLSEGDTVLTIRLITLPEVPTSVTATLSSAVTDVAGNGLAGASTSWSWTLPAWQDLQNPFARANDYKSSVFGSATVSPLGEPTVGLLRRSGSGIGASSALRWTGSSWVEHLATGTTPDSPRPPAAATAATGDLVLSWATGVSPVSLHAATWSDALASWTGSVLLNVDSSATARPRVPAMATDSAGRVVLAWEEGGMVYLRRLGAQGWEAPWGSAPVNPANAVYGPMRIYIDWAGSDPRVSGVNGTAGGLASWQGGAWTVSAFTGATPVGAISLPDFRADATGAHPFAAILDATTAPTRAIVRQATGGVFQWGQCPACALCCALNVSPTVNASGILLSLDPAGNPVAAWNESGSLYVKRWNGAAWESLGGDVAPGCIPGLPSNISSLDQLAVGSGGVVAVVWEASDNTAGSSTPVLCARRYNR